MSAFCTKSAAHLRRFTADFPVTINLNYVSIISVRWKKPRWIPKSQSKVFYVRKPTPILSDEYEMLKTKYSHYNTHIKALRIYFRNNYKAELQAEEAHLTGAEAKEDQEKFMKILEYNTLWNEESRRMRDERLEIENEKMMKEQQKKAALLEKAKENIKIKSQEYIQDTMKSANNFVTGESLDKDIEKLLNSRSDYNFAVDNDGTKVMEEDSNSTDNNLQESTRSG